MQVPRSTGSCLLPSTWYLPLFARGSSKRSGSYASNMKAINIREILAVAINARSGVPACVLKRPNEPQS